ncbi:bromodomain adjacent to zinc finger domain protein 2A isoform X3 [Oryzias melastigma]|uniref:bromodomain adjacent to zinc finger domain protein 2A isoform X3 n=1 Tax=Oryzias melastigma TaxID=30732 RepID=UPI000CF827D5|nr:bromodomain adjacent to zinc finger domain protein 2A isoform X3 [Oryzias melastigma]
MMDSNNHFNYGTHSSANSGLKLSSGDSPYTNGSSVSFPQQGKNLNGDMNVNGVSTVGSSGPASHQPSAPYLHLRNHHQNSMGYDYLWGAHPQYGQGVGSSEMHQKPVTSGIAPPPPPQSHHHFQAHGQYQLNGSIEGSHQPSVAGAANIPIAGNQYWSRSNPAPQQMGYNSQGMYGSYQNQAHPGISLSQPHQQQQQPSQQHLHSHRQPPHHHQQPPHYGMMPNGMPYYQQHSSPQQQQQQLPQPAPQTFTPPRGSPQHHSLGRGRSGSPLPVGVSTTSIMSPSAVQDSGSPRSHNRDRSPLASNMGMSSPVHGHAGEVVKEVDVGYNGSKGAPGYQAEPSTAHVAPQSDYRHLPDQPASQHPEMASPVRDPVSNPRPHSVSSPLSASKAGASTSLTKVSTPARVSAAPSFSGPILSGPPTLSSSYEESAAPQMSATPNSFFCSSSRNSSRLSSPPPVIQGLRSPSSDASEVSESKPPFKRSSSPSHRPQKVPLASPENFSESAAGPSSPPSSSPDPLVRQWKLESALKTASPYSPPHSAPVLCPEKLLTRGPKTFSEGFESRPENPPSPQATPPTLSPPQSTNPLSASVAPSLEPTSPGPSISISAVVSPIPIAGSKPSDPPTASQSQINTPAAVSPPSERLNFTSLIAKERTAGQRLFTLPPSTTQASRTAAVSSPPSSVSEPPAATVLTEDMQRSGSRDPAAAHVLPKSSSSESDRQGFGEESEINGKPEEHLPKPGSDAARTLLGEMSGAGTSGIAQKKLSETPGGLMIDQQTILKEGDSKIEPTPLRKSPPLNSTDDQTFKNRSPDSSQYDGNSTTASNVNVSSLMDQTSVLVEDSSASEDSFDHSFSQRKDGSHFHSTFYDDEGDKSAPFDSSRDGLSVETSRDETMESTRRDETSDAEETGSNLIGQSALESSAASCHYEEPAVGSWDASRTEPSVSSRVPGVAWEFTEHQTPDSVGHMDILTPPGLNMRAESFMAHSTPAESAAVQPVPELTAEGPPKTQRKPRKPRTPKASWVTDGAQRKPRVRTPKAEKPKADEDAKEDGPKGRKRKRSLKVNQTADVPGGAGPLAQEVDPIMAAIDAVLANASSISAALEKAKKIKRAKKQDQDGSTAANKQDAKTSADDGEENDDDSSTAGESNKRRVATEEQVRFPLAHGWRREIRVKKLENRMKGETWYYTPCGRRMKQFPEIIKYLKRHGDSVVTREHFSFSPRMPVGDFYEERDSSEGVKWVLLANEEVPSMIMAITGRRGRPPNPDKEKPRRVSGARGGQARRPGRPPKLKMVDLLSKVDAKLLKRLEAKEALTEEEKEKIAKIKKKMKRKARMKRRQDAKIKKMKEEKKKVKLEEEAKLLEGKAESTDLSAPEVTLSESAAEPKKSGRRRSVKVDAPAPVAVQASSEAPPPGNRAQSARSKAKALAKAQAEAEAAAQAALAAKRAAERRAQAQRRLEERKRQQLIADELKKPAEDMCLTDHKLLPELSRIPGLVLSGTAFAHCLSVVEFLHAYGKLIGIDVPKDIPSLATLQEGLLGLGDSQGQVQDLLIKLVDSALHDPGLPSYYQSVKILGDKLVELELTRSTVSEALRIFLESHGYETEVCNSLRTKPFHALPPDTKASILGFLVEELNGSNIVTSDIDNTLENMTTYRKNKWIIEAKLRKLKSVLAKRTGRSEEEICFEERRRSARVAEEENLSLEEGLILERGNRRARKEEPKPVDSESPAVASIPELERQIDKLTKRQAFFRKKLLQTSHSMRVIMLGQDRYRRRYLALPHLGAVLVEGPEELLTSEDVLVAEVPVAFLKKELKVEETPMPATPPPTLPSSPSSAAPGQAQGFSAEEDFLPGTASLMSTQRGRGRPRKIKPEVELHLRTAKIRRQRRSSIRSVGGDKPGSPSGTTQDLTQAAFQSWLSQSQEAATHGSCSAAGEAPEGNRPERSVKEMAEKQGQWFNLLPKQPCDENSLTEAQIPASPPKLLPQVQDVLATVSADLIKPDPLMPVQTPVVCADPALPQEINPTDAAQTAPTLTPSTPPQLTPIPISPPAPPPPPAPVTPTPPVRPARRRRRGSRGSSPARRGPRGAAAKRRGRPPNSVFQELEQQYFTQMVVKPIPASMVRGWWWVKDPEELYSTLQSLHPRGMRERLLHKHLAKHMESLTEMCTKPINDPIFESKVEEKDALLEALQQPWQVQDKTMETDVIALQWVEDLEQRVVAADLQMKVPPQNAVNDPETNAETLVAEFQPFTIPDPDSTREDLQYYEHDVDPRDDWIVRTKKEWSGLPRIATHPLDLAVLRLANLERNIERRYLKQPLWNPAEVMRLAPLTPTPGEEHLMDVISLESEITSRMRTWRQALDRCRSAPQLCLCLLQLEKAIAWERSITKVTCQVCRKGDNDECLLLCDGCDRGCHMYCLKPKITQVPEGDWFCPTCTAKDQGEPQQSSKKRTRVKRKRYEEESSEEETARRSGGMSTRHKDPPPAALPSRYSGEGGSAKRRRMTTRNQPDLTFCEIILMEMEAHADAWPFLEPVNPRLVPGYRRIIKNPMDFLTMRERLLQGMYCSCDEFAADAQLVFNNCELFNEDTSEVGMAGHSMRRFFESRWAEFYSNKDK